MQKRENQFKAAKHKYFNTTRWKQVVARPANRWRNCFTLCLVVLRCVTMMLEPKLRTSCSFLHGGWEWSTYYDYFSFQEYSYEYLVSWLFSLWFVVSFVIVDTIVVITFFCYHERFYCFYIPLTISTTQRVNTCRIPSHFEDRNHVPKMKSSVVRDHALHLVAVFHFSNLVLKNRNGIL